MTNNKNNDMCSQTKQLNPNMLQTGPAAAGGGFQGCRLRPPLPTSVDGRLQAQQQVGEAGLAGSGHGVGAAAVLPQVGLAGPGQRVANLVVLSNQLLSCGQGLTALRGQGSKISTLSGTATGSKVQRDSPFQTWPPQTCG